jgi:hypothetical protein
MAGASSDAVAILILGVVMVVPAKETDQDFWAV